ncbi:MAG: histidinol-phosphatase [Chloroflexi bacterium]|nr:histidinol-phosphatase [Chloroflexota bacterium]
MIPPFIIKQAQMLGLGLVAITDHNTVDNVAAVRRAADNTGITVLPGMEVQTREEAHILCLFERLDQAEVWGEQVTACLPPLRNDEGVFGAQFVVDETGDLIRMNERLLIASTTLSVEEVVRRVRELGGLAIAAHVDRPSFSLLSNLGFIPPGLELAALEISARTTPEAFRAAHPELADWPCVTSGDAHRLSEMRANTLFQVREPTLGELALALQGAEGRRTRILA